MEMRKRYKESVLKEHDVKLGFMSAFAKACTLALKEIPAANASIEGDEIVYRDYVDLSVAVATPKGLVTPVVRNAESLGFVDIERAIAALGKKVCGGAVDSLGVRLRLGGCDTDLGVIGKGREAYA
jgi:2-oxoglutarate dehydrogenase E2 component (dihydrolipoamide succinyltransferase)